MERILSVILALSLVVSMTACSAEATVKMQSVPLETKSVIAETTISENENTQIIEYAEPSIATELPSEAVLPQFTGLGDERLLQHVEDSVYSNLVAELQSEDYLIENVEAVYISKEYIEEVTYNSQSNIFFGYTLSELYEQFQGSRYVFTLGETGETVIQPFDDYDNTYEQVLKNVAIGAGVILICVTVSTITAGVGMEPISMVFAASAKTAGKLAASSSVFGGLSAGIVEGTRTGNFDAAIQAAALAGSEGFKWSAIFGAIAGGVTKLSAIKRATKAINGAEEVAKGTVEIAEDIPQWRQAELRALNEQGGYEQLSYLKGKQVELGTKGATRPDVVRFMGDHIEAVEVKYYNLEDNGSLRTLRSELEREITARVQNLPAGSTQRIVLDVTERTFDSSTIEHAMNLIWDWLGDIYPNIPIDVVGLA